MIRAVFPGLRPEEKKKALLERQAGKQGSGAGEMMTGFRVGIRGGYRIFPGRGMIIELQGPGGTASLGSRPGGRSGT